MKLNVTEHVENLTEFETINLRNHIGNAYNLAEDLDGCNPVEDYDIQRRKITDIRGEPPVESVVPILTVEVNTKDEAHTTFKIADEISKDHNVNLYDVWYDNNENKMIILVEPFEIE
jgi:hypothetical protein